MNQLGNLIFKPISCSYRIAPCPQDESKKPVLDWCTSTFRLVHRDLASATKTASALRLAIQTPTSKLESVTSASRLKSRPFQDALYHVQVHRQHRVHEKRAEDFSKSQKLVSLELYM